MITLRRSLFVLLLVLGLATPARAQNGTVMPMPKFTGFDNNGLIINGGKLCAYAAGTTTPQPTYSDVGLTVANSNPVILDPAGRATVFLSATSYKFVLRQPGTTTDCTTGTILWTQDNIGQVPTSATNASLLGTAGQSLTAGQVVYLSDGSGGKQTGQWFPADSSNVYSSVTPYVGIVPNAITSGNSGTVIITGSVSGLSALTIGVDYFASTAGTLTATAPGHRRYIGRADTATSLVLHGDPAPGPTFQPFLLGCGIRLTLTAGTPVTTADVTGAATVYATPYSSSGYGAGICSFYDTTTSAWVALPFTETSIALGTITASLPYDVFCYDNSGTMACELLAWTNTTTRATALVNQNGVPSKTGALTRRYIGTFYTTSTTTTEDSVTKRDLWNYYNRKLRPILKQEATANWTYNTATIRQANAGATNQIEFVIGVAESLVDARVQTDFFNAGGGGVFAAVGLGLDSTSTFITGGEAGGGLSQASATQLTGRYSGMPAVGKHLLSWNEYVTNSGTATTFYGNGGIGTNATSGIGGWIED